MAGRVRAVKAPRLDFAVTAEHIAAGIPKDSAHCMIADALREAMPNADLISADLATIRFTDRLAGRRYIYLTPIPAQQALIAFDQGEPVEPFHVRARAAQMIHTGAARRARRIQAEQDGEPLPEREPAKLVKAAGDSGTGSSVPLKVGGSAPPIGALAGGDTKGMGESGVTSQYRTGRRREYGLRALVR